MIVDANVLMYATNEAATTHLRAKVWLEDQLNGAARVGLPWPSLLAFMRLSTSLRMSPSPISGKQAWSIVQAWLSSPVACIPPTTQRHVEIFGALVAKYEINGNLVPDAHLAAYAIEHHVPLASADTDFARFTEVRWINPVSA
jgi:toxin-antitoxin system PIN domain toxin